MSIKAFGYNISSEEEERIIRPMAQVISSNTVHIFDLRSMKPDISSQDIVFTFGDRASRITKDFQSRIRLEFPDLPRLDRRFGEEELRKHALEQLLQLKKALSTNTISDINITQCSLSTTTITEENLPLLTSQEVLQQLQSILLQQEVKEWIGTTANGKIICLTVSPQVNETADINMTFAELFAMKIAMEALHIKELEIVYRPNNYRENSN